jgi:hypothetical protein
MEQSLLMWPDWPHYIQATHFLIFGVDDGIGEVGWVNTDDPPKDTENKREKFERKETNSITVLSLRTRAVSAHMAHLAAIEALLVSDTVSR